MDNSWQSAVAVLPAALQRDADQALTELYEACDGPRIAALEQLLADPAHARHLANLFAGSSFAAQLCRRRPDWLLDPFTDRSLERVRTAAEWAERARAALAGVTDVETLDSVLRQLRNREMLRILWRDFNRLADTTETTADVSRLAECCLQGALDFHHQTLCAELGTPVSADGTPQRLVVLGMGKLGAGELNLSSDIDLIFAYPENGETTFGIAPPMKPSPQPSPINGRRGALIPGAVSERSLGALNSPGAHIRRAPSIPSPVYGRGPEKEPAPVHNQEFFTRLGQRLIKSMDAITADGFVFRVDMRLRPYGDSGALVLSFDAMEEYYQDQGRDWERYAMIKARVVAGDHAAGPRLLETLRPFVYRRYLDFSAFDALRDMKRMIQREVQRRKLHDNIKLGAGGIREIEFIVQCFQLIRGGRDRILQERHLQTVLGHLEALGYLPADAVAELRTAYDFLRDTEHAIQGWLDRQTQELPAADLPRAALAHVMGFVDWPAFKTALDQHRDRVAAHFHNVIAAPEDETDSIDQQQVEQWRGFWRGLLSDHEMTPASAAEQLAAAGHEQPAEAARLLLALRASPVVTRMQTVGRERLDAFMPQLLGAVTSAERPSEVLLRILPLVEAVVRRTAYLVLLVENPAALQELVVLCAASPWIASQLTRHPVLLDELLDPRTLYHAPRKPELQDELRQQMLRVDWEDLEAQMEQLRYFRLTHTLRVIASEVTGRLPLMKVSDYLTWLAETILEHVLELAWRHLVARHGAPRPALQPSANVQEKHFIIVGYGKLGGIELGHGSDLDLVFIHDGDTSSVTDGAPADGQTPVDGATFFTRLGQRIIHILTVQTALGPLYEVDTRLRPSGNSGLLVSSLKSFVEYQYNSAWTWEHQALVRARPVAGDLRLAAAFDDVRRNVLCQGRDLAKLKQDVVGMREKMRVQLGPKGRGSDSIFDLKHSNAGIVDIEFMVQYAVLAWAGQYPALTHWTDNIRLLETLQQASLLSEADASGLIDAYKSYRATVHRLSLQQQGSRVPIEAVERERTLVSGLWRRLLLE